MLSTSFATASEYLSRDSRYESHVVRNDGYSAAMKRLDSASDHSLNSKSGSRAIQSFRTLSHFSGRTSLFHV